MTCSPYQPPPPKQLAIHQTITETNHRQSTVEEFAFNNGNKGIGIEFVDVPNDIERTALLIWKELFTNVRSIHI